MALRRPTAAGEAARIAACPAALRRRACAVSSRIEVARADGRDGSTVCTTGMSAAVMAFSVADWPRRAQRATTAEIDPGGPPAAHSDSSQQFRQRLRDALPVLEQRRRGAEQAQSRPSWRSCRYPLRSHLRASISPSCSGTQSVVPAPPISTDGSPSTLRLLQRQAEVDQLHVPVRLAAHVLSRLTSRLAGLMSRWRMFLAWAACMPATTGSVSARNSSVLSGPFNFTYSDKVAPSK